MNGNEALWVDEPARAVYTFIGADGRLHKEDYETSGRTLLWQEGGVAFRLSGAASREQALTLAAQP